MSTRRVVILVSGGGTNLQALLDAIEDGLLDANVVGVVSNRAGARALERAEARGIRADVLEALAGEARVDYDKRLAAHLSGLRPDLVVLAGWMRLLTDSFCNKYRIINLHPAKPGFFPGLQATERAFAAFKDGTITESGVMVHWVPDSGVDDGPVIEWRPVPIKTDDTFDAFVERVHRIEHQLIVSATAIALEQVHTSEVSRS